MYREIQQIKIRVFDQSDKMIYFKYIDLYNSIRVINAL